MRFFRTVTSYQLSVIIKKRNIYYLLLTFLLLFTVNCSLLTVTHAQESRPFLTDKDQFNYAMFLYEQGHYQIAAREFGRVIEYFPGSPVTPQAQYMIGDAYLNASLYKEAKSQFEQFMKNFPDNGFNAEASLKLDMAKAKLKEAELVFAPKLPTVKILPPSKLLTPNSKLITPMRAVQIALFEGKDYKEVDNEIGRLKASGIDTIILRVFHNKDDRFYPFINPKSRAGVYFTTKESPVVEDILGPVLDMAHKTGLKVFAWMTTRYADYGLEDKKDLGCKAYDFNTKDIVPCKGLDLFNEDAVAHLERLFHDLALYPIDGILFQDDLVLKHHEGFGPYSELLYKKDTGEKLIPAELYNNRGQGGKESRGQNLNAGIIESLNPQYTPEFWRWASWKNKRLLQVATRVRTAVKKKNPEVKFVINLMYESVSNPPYAMAWLSQSLDEAVKQGFDYYAIMAYHQQMQGELKKEQYEIYSLIERMTAEAVRLVGEPHRVLIKLQTIDWDTSRPLPAREVINLAKKVQEAGNISLAVVPYRKDFPFTELNRQRHSKLLQ